MAVLKSRDEWPVIKQEDNLKKGKLVRVRVRSGQFVKMYEADAIKQGLIPAPESKSRPKPNDKMLRPAGDKAQEAEPIDEEPAVEPEAQEDESAMVDFTTIPGVGQASHRALIAHGITSFDELATAQDLDFLSESVLQSIAGWALIAREQGDQPEEDLG